jgi:hypothetical protein
MPRAAENIGQRVVPFLARVLEDPLVVLPHRQHGRPRLRERRGIVDGVLVVQRVGVDARKALDQVQLLA